MRKNIVAMAIVSCLSGCASVEKWAEYARQNEQEAVDEYYEEKNEIRVSGIEDSMSSEELMMANLKYQSRQSNINTPYMSDSVSNQGQLFASGGRANAPLTKNINHYVRGIMHDLVENMQYVTQNTPVGVASFVHLDSNFDNATLLGNQIAESFMHEIHKFGIPVIDFKTTDYIRVTLTGDYVFSRDFLELKSDLPIKYILGGTLVKHQAGYLINARVVGIESKAVVASAQSFIPSYVTDALFNSDGNDGIPLMRGE